MDDEERKEQDLDWQGVCCFVCSFSLLCILFSSILAIPTGQNDSARCMCVHIVYCRVFFPRRDAGDVWVRVCMFEGLSAFACFSWRGAFCVM
jgi:hypothetical protein